MFKLRIVDLYIMNILAKIYQNPLLSERDVQRVYDAHELVTFKKGDFLLKSGQIADAYFCIQSGLVRSYVYNFDGEDITTDFFGQNGIAIDVVSLFMQVPAVEHMQALTQIECYKIKLEDFQELYHSLKGVSEWGRAWMSENLFKQKLRSLSMITDSASSRYEQLVSANPEIIQQAPLKNIASFLGITDTSLSRIRKESVLQR